jgi:peptide subunit release factor 1 (eRF1)
MEEEKELRFTCPTPGCGAKFEEPLSWFQNPSFTCPKCGNYHILDVEKIPIAKEFFAL